ncbi:DMT family transporter [Labrys neptuniae]|uniref:DMT family transporter n=1 Tax=Labrys neptuniae TaxID=376174 RepID=UPI00288F2621|nr:DMT family transporter [Labrys neptuniae]MDT3377978.1 DMT family transporter [Labrys neptuniae]
MAILLGLAAALCWGGTDFLGGAAARALGVRQSLFFSQAIGFAGLSLLVLVLPGIRGQMASAPPEAWLWGLAAALCNFLGMLALLSALARGKAALVAPLTATYGVITTLLSLATGEILGWWALAGLALCFIGVPCTVYAPDDDSASAGSRTSLRLALAAALFFGIGFWLQGHLALPGLGTTATLWLLYATNLICLAGMLAVRPAEFQPPPSSLWLLITAIGLLSLCGFGTLALGALTGAVAVVTVLSTLSGAVTAALGVVLRGERLSALQWFGIAAALLGVLLLRIGG